MKDEGLAYILEVLQQIGDSFALTIGEHRFVQAITPSKVVSYFPFEQVPEPLLANYGMAKIRLYQQDINMMNLLNSKERTLQEFIDLARQGGGFKFEHLWDSGEAGLIEFSAV